MDTLNNKTNISSVILSINKTLFYFKSYSEKNEHTNLLIDFSSQKLSKKYS